MDGLEQIVRWLHIFFGVIWIGLLYFFNFVNGPFAATMDGETKKKVVPELMPRALYWFRWGAAWTWLTGITLLMLVFYCSSNLFESGYGWTPISMALVAVVFLAFLVYDAIFKSPIGKDLRVGAAVGFVLVAAVLFAMEHLAGFSYRAYVIHIGVMFGTIMAANVWFRIWPAQQKIIAAVKAGTPPDAAVVALAGARSRHNTYLSVPLLWAMINAHTSAFSGGNFGIPDGFGFVSMLVFTLIGWGIVNVCYKRAAQVKGF